MSANKDSITHPGIISEIGKEKLLVQIMAQSACSSCHAKGMCSVAEMEEKIIEVDFTAPADYKIGQQITISMEKSMGSKAVLLGYFIPFIIVVGVLLILVAITGNEGLSALIAILMLAPYYMGLYLLKDKLSKTFTFKIKN